MSLLKRIFGKSDDRRDDPGETAESAPDSSVSGEPMEAQQEPEADDVSASSPKETPERPPSPPAPPRASSAPTPPAPVKKSRNESQTFQVKPPTPAAAEQNDAGPAADTPERRRIQIRSSETNAEEEEEDIRTVPNQDLRRSQTIRVTPPPETSRSEEAAPTIRDELRQSQTIRVQPPAAREPEMDPDLGTIIAAVPEAAGLGADSREEDDAEAREDERLEIPAMALIGALPPNLRGDAWRQGADPGGTFAMDRQSLMEQLQAGQVTVSVEDVADQFPDGWIADDAEGDVALDISRVVPAVPAEWLQVTAEEDDDVVAAGSMQNLFRPAEDTSAEPEPTAEAVSETEDAGDGDIIELPASVFLASVPGRLRGPAWQEGELKRHSLLVPKAALLEQLAAGSITVDVDDLREQLPNGWLADDASGDVQLDLEAVVSAMPPDVFEATGDMLPEVAESETIGALFGAPEAATEADADLAPKTPAAETPPRKQPPVDAPTKAALPLSTIAESLPKDARGPAWNADSLPEGTFDVDAEDLLEQLAAGRVAFAASALQTVLPDGWVAEHAEEEVELDLAAVVQALPQDFMEVQADVAEDVEASAAIGVLFQSAEPVDTSPAEEEKHTEEIVDEAIDTTEKPTTHEDAAGPEEVHGEQQKEPEEEELEEEEPEEDEFEDDEEEVEEEETGREWDGVEPSLEMAPLGIDINTANVEKLAVLPSVGEVRAGDIVAYRRANGPFESVFDLANVPGVGPASFRKMTGFSLRRRTSRHEKLFDMLKLKNDGRPVLTRIAEALCAECHAAGCLLTNQEGIPLTVSGDMPDATTYAALGSRYFFRTRRHLQRFVDKASDCIILPGSKPPLLLLARNDVVAIFTLSESGVSSKRLRRLRRAMRELGWLLSHRAVVMDI